MLNNILQANLRIHQEDGFGFIHHLQVAYNNNKLEFCTRDRFTAGQVDVDEAEEGSWNINSHREKDKPCSLCPELCARSRSCRGAPMRGTLCSGQCTA